MSGHGHVGASSTRREAAPEGHRQTDSAAQNDDGSASALIFDIRRNCREDGPGIRTTVFFKGCSLRCAWCQNPEGIQPSLGLSFDADRCDPRTCGQACVSACESGCLSVAARLELNRAKCVGCGQCHVRCPTQALTPVGARISLDELVYRVLVDEPFYGTTGGGVTLSGGEPTQQLDFVSRFLQRLRARGVHTALETCGHFAYSRFASDVLPHLDLVYYDLKLFDPELSARHTGVSSHSLLNNFARLARTAAIPVIPRIPLVPGITATQQNLSALAAFLRQNGSERCVLLPYNPTWLDKLGRLGLRPAYRRQTFMTPGELQECAACLGGAEPSPECAPAFAHQRRSRGDTASTSRP